MHLEENHAGGNSSILSNFVSVTMGSTTTPVLGRPKLRDSCNACSASKFKYNRDKPICARCAKRGLACEYLVTRRAGRKHDKSHSRSNTTSSDLPLFAPDWSVVGTPIPTSTTSSAVD
ncbi:hypothetical protein ASPBRDRAFT_25088 [Aspergillus brasiliensis CBS 101740]|uniref:Zn(2)-C6 fungal-type domain-containing protein n=1 Tax=Aspergillus brasiliensis (strain CBS 101740 / IMI 381727 / IBT 21946) TaxID=767769 RepID=A0A1L9V0J5_ASPBC|nr:hypothetical protein ASPBRDRAFT_25088 [Aspergillus brasiliensis CBS 101740]